MTNIINSFKYQKRALIMTSKSEREKTSGRRRRKIRKRGSAMTKKAGGKEHEARIRARKMI